MDVLVSAPGGASVRVAEPIRLGVPFAQGQCHTTSGLVLVDSAGKPRPLQTRALDWWPDGSVRWLLVDALVDHDRGPSSTTYKLTADSSLRDVIHERVSVTEQEDAFVVDTGSVTFAVARRGRRPFHYIRAHDVDLVAAERTGLRIEAEDGELEMVFNRAELEDAGPVTAIVRLQGEAKSATRHLFVSIRLQAFAGSAVIRFEVSFHNSQPAAHRGGFWELGEESSVVLREASLTIAPAIALERVEIRCSPEIGAPFERHDGSLELFQASSGGENWLSANHVDRTGRVPLEFRGYRLTSGSGRLEGYRATPIVALASGTATITVACPQFWQNFPRAVAVSGAGVKVGFFPRQHGAGHELQPGEQKTHVCLIDVSSKSLDALDWTRTPLFVRVTPQAYCGSGAIPYLIPLVDEPHMQYAALVQEAIEGADSFDRKREVIDEYGWRHFGELYADHEAVFYKGTPPVHSHYNNQYDALAGFVRQFARSGDCRWYRQLCELAGHVIDIDIYRTTGDKSAYNHGLFWHTAHYADAGRSTHRSYPRAAGVAGGGPSAEHNYTTGLLYYHYLTGDPAARDAVTTLARWVIDMDDGSSTRFRWLSRADTGLASATYAANYQGPGRGAGHSIAALIDAYHLTGESVYIQKAEELIRRCIHPDDDIEAWRLLDAERRWSYTIFLHVLGRYLDEKVLRSQLDGMYVYARRALLAYAEWMTINERPYFDRRDELEYATETWLAQELWKSEVFSYAAKYAENAESRARFRERSCFFFDYAIAALSAAPTKTLARPMVLLLSRGLMHGYMVVHAEEREAPAAAHVTEIAARRPGPFVPQKARAIRRAKALVVVVGLALAGAAVLWLA